MTDVISILLVEDSSLDAELITEHLRSSGISFRVTHVDNKADYFRALQQDCPTLILADYTLPAFDGLAALTIAQEACPDVPFLLVSGAMGEELAVEALKKGATDYVLKQRLARLGPAVRRAIDESHQKHQRKQAEEELARKAKELIIVNQDLEQFAYAASHDLQEPLRTISIFSGLLIKKYRGKIDGEADEFLGYIESAAKHMSALLSDLLLYAQIPIQDREKSLADVDVNQLLQQTLFLFKITMEETKAVVTSDTLPVIPANASQIGLVLQNLISNSLNYRSGEPPRIHVSSVLNDNFWVFSVRDNGQGFESIYADHVFGAFKRLKKGDASGTGLGLAICKRIIEIHGGRIWAESKPGQGAIFFFTIPARRDNRRSDKLSEARLSELSNLARQRSNAGD